MKNSGKLQHTMGKSHRFTTSHKKRTVNEKQRHEIHQRVTDQVIQQPNSCSTDSGRSSISDHQQSPSEESTDKMMSPKSKNHCDKPENHSSELTITDINMYTDVTLIPKCTENISIKHKIGKQHKRISRSNMSRSEQSEKIDSKVHNKMDTTSHARIRPNSLSNYEKHDVQPSAEVDPIADDVPCATIYVDEFDKLERTRNSSFTEAHILLMGGAADPILINNIFQSEQAEKDESYCSSNTVEFEDGEPIDLDAYHIHRDTTPSEPSHSINRSNNPNERSTSATSAATKSTIPYHDIYCKDDFCDRTEVNGNDIVTPSPTLSPLFTECSSDRVGMIKQLSADSFPCTTLEVDTWLPDYKTSYSTRSSPIMFSAHNMTDQFRNQIEMSNHNLNLPKPVRDKYRSQYSPKPTSIDGRNFSPTHSMGQRLSRSNRPMRFQRSKKSSYLLPNPQKPNSIHNMRCMDDNSKLFLKSPVSPICLWLPFDPRNPCFRMHSLDGSNSKNLCMIQSNQVNREATCNYTESEATRSNGISHEQSKSTILDNQLQELSIESKDTDAENINGTEITVNTHSRSQPKDSNNSKENKANISNGLAPSKLESFDRRWREDSGTDSAYSSEQEKRLIGCATGRIGSCLLPSNPNYFYSTDGQIFIVPHTALYYPHPTNPFFLSSDVSSMESAYTGLSSTSGNSTSILHHFPSKMHAADHAVLAAGHLLANGDFMFDLPLANMCDHPFVRSNSGSASYAQNILRANSDITQWPAIAFPTESSIISVKDFPHNPTRSIIVANNDNMSTNSVSTNSTSSNYPAITQNRRNHDNKTPHMSSPVKSHTKINPARNAHNYREQSHTASLDRSNALPNTQDSFKVIDSHKSFNKVHHKWEQTGLLGSAKSTLLVGHGANSSILGDSKSSNVRDDPYKVGNFSQIQANRQKKHSSKTNLYIRGLPSSFTEDQLHDLAPDKELIRSVKLISGSDGEMYGFIDFVNNTAARMALFHIKSMNKELYVNFAYESEKDPQNVYITNIPETWTASNVEDLKNVFQTYGQISTAIVMTKRSNNFCTGAGFVRFVRADDAQKAIDGIRSAQITLDGAKGPLEVKLADRQKPTDDQISMTKVRISNPSARNDDSLLGYETIPDSNFEAYRQHCNQRPEHCLLPTENPFLNNTINSSTDTLRSIQQAMCFGLCPNSTNLQNYAITNTQRFSNPATLTMTLQNALTPNTYLNTNLLFPNQINALNLQLPISVDAANPNNPAQMLNYPCNPSPSTAPLNGLIQPPRSISLINSLLPNQQTPPNVFTTGTNELIPVMRAINDLSHPHISMGLTAFPQNPSFIQGQQQNYGQTQTPYPLTNWTPNLVAPGLFASM